MHSCQEVTLTLPHNHAADCSVQCHKAHWKQHKKECAQLRQWRLDNKLPKDLPGGAAAQSGAVGTAAQQSSGPANQPSEASREAGGAAAPEQQQQQQQRRKKAKGGVSQRCGLCGNRRGPFTRTECCNKLVCDDYDDYVLMR